MRKGDLFIVVWLICGLFVYGLFFRSINEYELPTRQQKVFAAAGAVLVWPAVLGMYVDEVIHACFWWECDEAGGEH